MEQLLTFLNKVHPLSAELSAYLKECLKYREIHRKDYILKAGNTCRHIHFIQTGLLRCFYNKGTTEVCSWFMKEGDVIISVESFFQQKESYENMQALEDCSLFYIDYTSLDYIYKNFAEFNYVGQKLTLHYFILLVQQLYGIRMQTSYERYHWLITNFPELAVRVPGKYIASYLGITEVTFSKMKGMR